MLKRLPYLIALVFVSVVVSLRASPPIGAVVQTWRYDATTNTVNARILNTSQKDITSFNISIVETFADGSVGNHEVLVDMLDTVALVQRVRGTIDEDRIRKKFGNGTLPARQSRDQVFNYPAGKIVTNFEGTIDMVAYADDTAEATNSAALARVKEHRNAELRSHQKANEVLKGVLADSTIKKPSEEAASRLETFLTVLKAQTQSNELGLDAGTIEGVLRDLKNGPHVAAAQHLGETEFLQKYAAQEDQHISVIFGHSQLKTVGAQ
jgi:hypothetical protein